MSEITARARKPIDRISQGDVFQNITMIENVKVNRDEMELKTITFPYVICLNQDCDLNSDKRDKDNNPDSNKNCRLLHLIVAPLFVFASFIEGNHWGDIFDHVPAINTKKTEGKKIMNNEDPRYHYLHFNAESKMPDMVIDFKHFFTISTELLYDNLDNRVCSVEELYREKISQRFAYYISRIGLPD